MNLEISSSTGAVATRGKLLVISRRYGRLANRLMLSAHVAAFAEDQGHRLLNLAFQSYADLFETMRSDVWCRYPAAAKRGWIDSLPGATRLIRKTRLFYHLARAASRLNETLPVAGGKVVTLRELPGHRVTLLDGPEVQDRIRDARIVLMNGWKLRAPACVRKHAEKIRRYFRPAAECDAAGDRAVGELRRTATVVVGVHLRQGDYRRWQGGRLFFPAARYAEWMREFAAQFPGTKVAFLVCSDEPRSEQEFSGLTVGFGPGTPVRDIAALARCDYLFGPESTFSRWASFYGNVPMLQFGAADERVVRDRFAVSWLEDL